MANWSNRYRDNNVKKANAVYFNSLFMSIDLFLICFRKH